MPWKSEFHGVRVFRMLRPPGFGHDELGVERLRQPRDDLILHVKQIGDRLFEALGPKVLAGFRIDQLHIDAKPLAAALHRALSA